MLGFTHRNTTTKNADATVLTNEASGVTLTATSAGDAVSYVMQAPAFAGEDAAVVETTDEAVVRRAYLERHLRWLTVKITETIMADNLGEEYEAPKESLGLPAPVLSIFDDLSDDIRREIPMSEQATITLDAIDRAGYGSHVLFPGTVMIREPSGTTYHRNDATDIVVTARTTAAGLMYTVEAPAIEGEDDSFYFCTDNWEWAQSTYAERWLKTAAVTIGTGFHPDTRAPDYVTYDEDADALVPGLGLHNAALLQQYDAMMEFCFQHLENPYGIGLDAWKQAGLIEPEAPASQPTI
jgi:hypothetical protein